MKKKGFAALLALILVLGLAASAAAKPDQGIKSLEYKGFGVIKAELERKADWYNEAKITLTTKDGSELDWVYLGGDDEEFYLRSKELADGDACTLQFSLGDANQNITFDCNTGVEYRIKADGSVDPRKEDDDCDFCRSRGHDEDFCPERIDEANLPEDADSLARIFNIERCDRCNGMGHDDDRCPN